MVTSSEDEVEGRAEQLHLAAGLEKPGCTLPKVPRDPEARSTRSYCTFSAALRQKSQRTPTEIVACRGIAPSCAVRIAFSCVASGTAAGGRSARFRPGSLVALSALMRA